MAELEPSFDRSSVNGMPSLFAISFTFSWLAFCSSDFVDTAAAAGVIGAATTGAGGAITLAAITGAAATGYAILAFAITLAINCYWVRTTGVYGN